MKNFFNNKWMYRLFALLLAVLLFAYVNSAKVSSTRQQTSTNSGKTSLTATKKESVRVPLQLDVNSQKYFVTGYPEMVKVVLSGPSALVTTTANTQNFKVYASLKGLGTGSHKVKLHIEGLNKDIQARLTPRTITVDVQTRKTKSFKIQTKYNSNNIAEGYVAGKPTTGTTSVKATGAAGEIARITSVVAQINVPQQAKTSVNSQAIIEALDKSGKTVNVILTPSTTTANLPITANGKTKKVNVKFKAKNGSSNTDYKFTSTTKSIEVIGTSAELADLDDLTVSVDVSGITKTSTKTVSLNSSEYNVKSISPNRIKVKVQATATDDE